jgi:hypothetical protein
MKKFMLLIILVFLSAGVTFGQFSFGLKIGYNASKLHTSIDSIASSFNSGFHFGAFVRFGKKVYIQPELYYTLQGGVFKNNVSNTYNNWKQKVTVGTMDIPVLVGFKLIDVKAVNWRIMAGPMVSFLVNSKITDVNLNPGPIVKSDISSVNWYVQVGSGVDFLFMTFDIRYQIGLNQMIKSAASLAGKEYDLNATNNMWVVTLGFKL